MTTFMTLVWLMTKLLFIEMALQIRKIIIFFYKYFFFIKMFCCVQLYLHFYKNVEYA